MPNFKGWEILIIIALILLLFGAKRLPDAARGLGRSLRIFKAETSALHEDSAKGEGSGTAAAASQPQAAEAAPTPESLPPGTASPTPSTGPRPERTES